MKTVSDVLKVKGTEVLTVLPKGTLHDALIILRENNVGALVVVTDEGEVTGIFSERDFVRYCADKASLSLDAPLSEVMTSRVICVDPSYTIDHCMAIMTKMRLRHLPVLKDNTLTGLISIGDVVKAVQSEKDELIDQLEHYIAGSL